MRLSLFWKRQEQESGAHHYHGDRRARHSGVRPSACLTGVHNKLFIPEQRDLLTTFKPDRGHPAVWAMLLLHGLKVGDLKRFVAGTDVFSKQSDGTTVAAQYALEGITLRRQIWTGSTAGRRCCRECVTRGRILCRGYSCIKGAGAWRKRCRRYSMIRIGLRISLQSDLMR